MTKTPQTPVNVNDVTRISAGAHFKGDIRSSSDVRVDGTVEGTIYSEGKIVIGEEAVVRGTLLCNNLDFWGKMEGDIYTKDTLSIKGSASLSGNIFVRRLQVEIGAQFNGRCSMISEEDFDKKASTAVEMEATKA